MTIAQIQIALSPVKPVSLAQLKRYIRATGIKPLGVRQKPQHYPDEAPGLILRHLGFDRTPSQGIVSMKTLRHVRDRSAAARRGK
jgi:hypothetical protein